MNGQDEMKKILFLTTIYENYGGYYRCINLGKHLVKKGFKVEFICASGRNFDLKIRRKKLAENLTLITLPRIKYHQFFTGQLLRMVISCFQVLIYDYDLFHAFTVSQPQSGVPAWVAKKIRGKKLVVDWEDLWGGGFAERCPFPVKQVLTFFEIKIPPVADYVTVVSRFLRKKAEDLGLDPRKTALIPNGANIAQIKVLVQKRARAKLGLKLNEKIVVAVGHTYLDSLGILFKAFKAVLKKHPEARLVMVGGVVVPEKFQSLYEDIKNNLVLTGKRPFSEVPYYLAAADVLTLPMDDDPIERARFPMRLGDYLAAGRPIVSNAVGEVKYYLEKYQCGLTSPPTDPAKMAEKILYLFNHPEKAKQLGKKARALAEGDLDWDKIVSDLASVYQKVIS